MTAIAVDRPRVAVDRAPYVEALFFATVFTVTFAKLQWEVAGTMSFSDVVTACVTIGCSGAISDATTYIRNTLPGKLNTVYAAIQRQAPTARVAVLGYPRLFMGVDCNAGTFFGGSEMTRLNQTADLLNAKLAAAASAKGFAFANPTTAFVGHAVCSSTEWLNGLSNPTSESYHPNRTGHSSGYTPLVKGLLV